MKPNPETLQAAWLALVLDHRNAGRDGDEERRVKILALIEGLEELYPEARIKPAEAPE